MLTALQLAKREYRIGASEVATIFGQNPYCSPYELWARKTGRLLDVDERENEAIELGNAIEPALLSRYERRTGRKLLRGVEIAIEGLPVVVTLDGLAEDRSEVVEAKTACLLHDSPESVSQWTDDEFPGWYWWQIQTQMHAAKIRRGCLTALVGGKGYKDYPVEYDESRIPDAIVAACQWWDLHVAFDNPPIVEERDIETFRKIRPNAGEEVELDDGDAWAVDRILDLQEQAREIKQEIDELKGSLIMRMGLATEGLLPDDRIVTFREQGRCGYTVGPKRFRTLEIPGARSRRRKTAGKASNGPPAP